MNWVMPIVIYVLGFVISNVAFEEKDGKNHMGEHLFWFITIPMKLYKTINNKPEVKNDGKNEPPNN